MAEAKQRRTGQRVGDERMASARHSDLEELRALLGDPWVTEQRVHRGGDDLLHVWVAEVREVAEGRFQGARDIERLLDELVEAAGGERIDIVDPWRAGANLLRRLVGRPTAPSDDLYAIPRSVVDGPEAER